jgi:hypothetical protein
MVEIPPALIEAVREQRAVIFLGAGASIGANHPNGHGIPQGNGLRDLICDRFLGGKLKDKPLNFISSMAANEVGLAAFQGYIRDLFLPFGPANFHKLIPQFRWRAIATTNFDLLVERAYEADVNRLQGLVKTVKDGDRFDIRMNQESNPVGFYKLHGCIDHYTDAEIPIILGNEQYASYEENRGRFYGRFRDLGHEYPVVFIGYSIADPHIQRILFDLTDTKIKRPPFYILSPGISEIEARYWAAHRVFAINATFEQFLQALDNAIPALARALPVGLGGGQLTIRKHYRIADASESESLYAFLSTDVIHVHSGMTSQLQDPVKFYHGYDNGWGCILQNLDARRLFSDSVLVDAVLVSEGKRHKAELFMLKGPAGNGKTVSLKRIAWETGVTYDQIALFAQSPAGLRIDPIAEIHRLTGKRVFLFVDRVALVRSELRGLLEAAGGQSIPITVVGAERNNEWNIYCEQLEPFVRQEFPVRYLSEREIVELLGLLERHNALGLLKERTAEDRLYAFSKSAERQLLVALHEATLGLPFEDIVLDEYRRIEPETARSLYLDICALHQFGAPVRAGLISRASGVSFDEFQQYFIEPLENVVHVVTEGHNRDVMYRSRHQHVAEIVFNRVLGSPGDRFDLLARLLTAMNVDYSSDRETFSRLVRGRAIAEMFASVELGRLFYDRVRDAVPDDPFVLHQRAVFEAHHPGGSLEEASTAATRAHEMLPHNHSIEHTQAEIARRMANATDDPLRKRAFRRESREKLGGDNRGSEYDTYTRARLAIDEFKEIAENVQFAEDKPPPAEFVNAARDAEMIIQKAKQLFPDSPEMLAAEATFREAMEQTARAQRALERAFALNPRQDWLAVRLARKYQQANDLASAKRVLDACLHDNPSSKPAHQAIGHVLAAMGDSIAALDHYRRGFTEGDTHYEAQFWYGRELFIQGHFLESERVFEALNDRAPGRFRNRSSEPIARNAAPAMYDCQIVRQEEGYAFVRVPAFQDDLFASRGDSEPAEWERLANGGRATCEVSFARRGPRATKIRSGR